MSTLRIGDAERDAAMSRLGEHYAAGRLTKEEFDERADQVSTAQFSDDVTPLFADLPTGALSKPGPSDDRDYAHSARRRRAHPALRAAPLLWFAPLMVLGAIAVVATLAIVITPWLLFILFWFACAGPSRARRMSQRRGRPPWHAAHWSGQGARHYS